MNPLEIWDDFELSLSADDVLRGQGADPVLIRQRRPRLVTAAEQAIILGVGLLHPLAAVQDVEVKAFRHEKLLLGAGRLSGPLISSQLSTAARVAAVVCTVGEEIQHTIRQLESSDMILALALDGLANAAVDDLSRQICTRLSERAAEENLKTSTPISPGAPDWPVEIGQPEVFALVDAGPIGVSLNPSALMSPRKSASFVVGLGAEMTPVEPCQICNLQDVCRYRQASANQSQG